jgi:hypothetical protein
VPRWTGALAILLALALYWPTFGISWAYDDLDYLNVAALMLSGQLGFLRGLFQPQGEHVTAGLRLVLLPYLDIVGINAMPFRVFIAIVHALSGVFLGILARHCSGSSRAGVIATVVYVGACGLSSMWIWAPCGATVPLAMALITGAALLVLRGRRVLAGFLIVLALLTESAFAPMALLPVVVDRWNDDRRLRPSPFTIFVLAAIAIAGALLPRFFAGGGRPISIDVTEGLPRAAFLLFSAPIRLFVPGTHIVAWHLGLTLTQLGLIVGVILLITIPLLLFRVWRGGVPPLARFAAIASIGPIGVIVLVGLGRWNYTYWQLFEADRYYFPLLVPIALFSGAVATSVRSRIAIAALLVLLCGELAFHRWAMMRRIPFDIYARHEALFERLSRVVDALDPERGMAVPNNSLWFAGIHNGRISAPILTHILSNGSLRLLDRVDDATAARVNGVLAQHDPAIRIVGGRLTNTDFRTMSGPFEIAGHASIELMIAPSHFYVRLETPRPGQLRVTATDVETGFTAPLATIDTSAPTHAITVEPITRVVGNGKSTRFTFETADGSTIRVASAGTILPPW